MKAMGCSFQSSFKFGREICQLPPKHAQDFVYTPKAVNIMLFRKGIFAGVTKSRHLAQKNATPRILWKGKSDRTHKKRDIGAATSKKF